MGRYQEGFKIYEIAWKH